jgi:hypothetical protein
MLGKHLCKVELPSISIYANACKSYCILSINIANKKT